MLNRIDNKGSTLCRQFIAYQSFISFPPQNCPKVRYYWNSHFPGEETKSKRDLVPRDISGCFLGVNIPVHSIDYIERVNNYIN